MQLRHLLRCAGVQVISGTLNAPRLAFPIAVLSPWTTTTSPGPLPAPAPAPDPHSVLHKTRLGPDEGPEGDKWPEMIFNLCIAWSSAPTRTLITLRTTSGCFSPDGSSGGTNFSGLSPSGSHLLLLTLHYI